LLVVTIIYTVWFVDGLFKIHVKSLVDCVGCSCAMAAS